MNAPLEYLSGEEILKGDRVLFHGNPAEIELVAVDPNDPEHVWHVREFGGRVLASHRSPRFWTYFHPARSAR